MGELPVTSRPPEDDEPPVIPDVPEDDTDRGWGDEPAERSHDWYRRERPPHHE
jgi:hypothetical protein